MVDSNDRDRIDESRDELAWLLSEDELNDCFLMVMANKQDLPNAMSLNTVANRLGLNLLLSRTWSELYFIFHQTLLELVEYVHVQY